MSRMLTWVSDKHLTGWTAPRATGLFLFRRFSAILKQRRLTTGHRVYVSAAMYTIILANRRMYECLGRYFVHIFVHGCWTIA